MSRPTGRWVALTAIVGVAVGYTASLVPTVSGTEQRIAVALAAGVTCILIGALGAILHRHQVRAFKTTIEHLESRSEAQTRRLELHMVRELGAATALATSYGASLMPALAGMALAPTVLHAYLRLLLDVKPRSILEVGAGASTIHVLRLRQEGKISSKIVAIDHDPSHLDRVRRWAEQAGVDPRQVRWIHAPLVATDHGEWYSLDRLDHQEAFDVVLVDGPPNPDGNGRRRPAFEALRDRLASGAHLLVDDTDRPDEARMVEDWVRNDHRLEVLYHGSSHVVLRYSG